MAHGASVIISIVILILIVIYAIFLWWAYRNGKFIFSSYVLPPLKNGFQPGGQVIFLTAQEIAARKAAIGVPSN